MSGDVDELMPPGPEGGPLSSDEPRAAEPTEAPSGRTSVASPKAAELCPECGTKRIGDDVYCEGCGYDFVNRAPKAAPAPATQRWEAVIAADRVHFERGEWLGVDFPDRFVPLTIPLDLGELRIGRGELDARWPEIDLEDPAVSRFHALLARQDDGSFAIVDQGSTNGTTLNDDPTPLAAKVAFQLKEGDRVHIGAWTTISLRRVGSFE